MHARAIRPVLEARLRDYPAATLVGPRQCGKTTLARAMPGAYFDLEQESERLRLDIEWPQLVRGNKRLILDEAQTHPEIFARVRGAIDEQRRRAGRFLLLGSVSPALMRQVSESLAGRLAVVEMTPFLRSECPTKASLGRHWLVGGYPDGGLLSPRRFSRWQDDYLALLVQRDLPAWGLPARAQLTDRLIRMLAAWHGQAWNASRLAQSLGINYQTVSSYVDYLEGAYLVRRLLPYHANIGKRIVKAPKVYLRDTGLLHSILGVVNKAELLASPWVGSSWEGYVIEQVLGRLTALDKPHQAHYLRTSDQYEADLLIHVGRETWALEVKLTTNPTLQDLRRIKKVSDMVGAQRALVLSQVPRSTERDDVVSCNLDWFLRSLADA
jgi:predicted AAA+ superfamily ATPase